MVWNSTHSHHAPQGSVLAGSEEKSFVSADASVIESSRLDRFEQILLRWESVIFPICKSLCRDAEAAERSCEGAFLSLYRCSDDLAREVADYGQMLVRWAIEFSRTEDCSVPLNLTQMGRAELASVPDRLGLSRLLGAQREVIVLRFVAKLEIDQIADTLQCDREEVRVRLWNAMRALDRAGLVHGGAN
ncbi:MAG: hypothetical protein KDN20_17760 [Verrucomicrobiae bacterium]|nr:hypothetical protein [Verrucomicrobiae bacterium]